MKFTRRTPCPNCPFRKSAKLAYWHPTMYIKLKSLEEVEGEPLKCRPFGCHQDRHSPREDREPCVGWIIHQRENGVPSLALRVLLAQHREEGFAQFNESQADGELYETVDELVRLNLAQDEILNPHRYDEEGSYIPQRDDEEVT